MNARTIFITLIMALTLVAGPVAAHAGCGDSQADKAAAAADNAFDDVNPGLPGAAPAQDAPASAWSFQNGRMTYTAASLAGIVASAIAVPVAMNPNAR